MKMNFMEKRLINHCANTLGISALIVEKMFDLNVETNCFIRRRISFGLDKVEDNIGVLLKGLLQRDVNNLNRITPTEAVYIKEKYGLIVDSKIVGFDGNEKAKKILSEKVEPLVLGILGETILRECAKVLGIARKDAVKLVKSNDSVKSFLQREQSLSILDKKSCISVILQNTLNRAKNDFSPIKEGEINMLYRKYMIEVTTNTNVFERKAIQG